MLKGKINIVLIAGFLSLITILFIQINWIKQSIAIQETNIAIHEKKDSLFQKQINEKIHIALSEVLNEISKKENHTYDTYGAVKQIQNNYYSVDINEELHPYYLESLLKKAFYKEQIFQDFQFSIYDCFSDSVIYGKAVEFSDDSLYLTKENSDNLAIKSLKWKKDGHYFTVYFPNIQVKSNLNISQKYNPWPFVIPITIIVLLFTIYTVSIIKKQNKVDEIKTDFINNMTHELKTPISSIALSSQYLMKKGIEQFPEKINRYASIIYKENKRLESQVNNVLDIAKLEKKKLEFKNEEIHLHDIIKEAKETFANNQMENTDGQLTLNLNAKNDLILGDVIHITNVIYNLIDNAIKYSEDKPVINIITKNEDENLILSIKDNGIGIAEDQIKNIFDKFYRIPTGNIHNVKGFGIGLYYVQLIIKAHKGTLNVKSKLIYGTEFIINLTLKN